MGGGGFGECFGGFGGVVRCCAEVLEFGVVTWGEKDFEMRIVALDHEIFWALSSHLYGR